MDTCIKTRVLTRCYCAGSGEEDVMEDINRETNNYVHKVTHAQKKRILTRCYCAGSGEEGVMEDVKRETNNYVHKVDGHM